MPMSGPGKVKGGSGTSTRLSRFRRGAMGPPVVLIPKTKFKAAWERFYASLTPRDIEIWHRTEDRSWLK